MSSQPHTAVKPPAHGAYAGPQTLPEAVPKFQGTDRPSSAAPRFAKSKQLVANQMAKASFAGRTSPAKNDLVQRSPKIYSKDEVKHCDYSALTFFLSLHFRTICPLRIVLQKTIHLVLQTLAFSLRTSAPSSSHESNGRSQASFSFEKYGEKLSKAIN